MHSSPCFLQLHYFMSQLVLHMHQTTLNRSAVIDHGLFIVIITGRGGGVTKRRKRRRKKQPFQGISFPLILLAALALLLLYLCLRQRILEAVIPCFESEGCMFDGKQHQQLASHGQTRLLLTLFSHSSPPCDHTLKMEL